ncbi:MAG: response regulator [Candidatus Omnitrophica bacterium]|nr:response regulator [Candidatus Omnitrophota bacterium]
MQENSKCILVIDDDDDVRQLIKEKFEILGYRVMTAADGADGLRKTVDGRPHIVLLDVRIPKGEDGVTYFRKLRSYHNDDAQEQARVRKTPVIVLTGVGATMQSFFELEQISGFIEKPFDPDGSQGIRGFVEKPFDLETLRIEVERVLRTS